MKATNACLPCMIQQAHNTTERCTADPALHRAIMDAVMRRYTGLPLDRTPGELSQIAHDTARELAGIHDPYLAAKAEANQAALALHPGLRARLQAAADPLRDAALLALAGNIIDLGINQEYDLTEDIVRQIERGFDVAEFDAFRVAVAAAGSILYVLDNAGEIVFDRLLIEVMGPERVTAMVKAGPIVNDALIEDARQVGLTETCRVVDTGSGYFGFPWGEVSEAARAELLAADLVISKGHANFETLSELGPEGDRIWYLLKAKCNEVARELHARLGDTALLSHHTLRTWRG
jgi:hypothetical protein